MSGGRVEQGMTRRVALRLTSTFGQPLLDRDDLIVGEHSGVTLLRRLVAACDDPVVVLDSGPMRQTAHGYAVSALQHLPVNDVVVVNFDVLDSLEVWRGLRRDSWRRQPSVVNFAWWNVSDFTDPVDRASLAMSCGLLPTYANSPKCEREVRQAVADLCAPAVSQSQRITSRPLGIDVDAMDEALAGAVRAPRPVVLYPGIHAFARKRPEMFVDVALKVAASTGCGVRMRLHERDRGHAEAVRLAAAGGEVLGLPESKAAYYRSLGTDVHAALATSLDESYGLAYVEALYAGVPVVFPRRKWVEQILPPDWPLVASNQDEMAAMLHVAVTQPDLLRVPLTAAKVWIRSEHDARTFDRAMTRQIGEWSA